MAHKKYQFQIEEGFDQKIWFYLIKYSKIKAFDIVHSSLNFHNIKNAS